MGLLGKIFSKNKDVEIVENVNSEVTGKDIIIAGEKIKEGEEAKEDPSVYYVLFANKIAGFKGVPYDMRMLLVNDHSMNNLVINYELDGEVKKDIISRNNIQNVDLISRVQMEINNNLESKDIDKRLISASLFGGVPLEQYLSGDINSEINSDKKVDLNTYYELTITYINDENENKKIVFRINNNPEKFVNFLKSNIGHKQ